MIFRKSNNKVNKQQEERNGAALTEFAKTVSRNCFQTGGKDNS